MRRRIHLIYAADDGLMSLRCGVGTMARHFILAFPEIAAAAADWGIELRLSAVTVKHRSDALGLRPDFAQQTSSVCQKSGGDLHYIPALTDPHENYFQFGVWEEYTAAASRIIDDITSPNDEQTIVIASEAIFAHCFGKGKRSKTVWIPHTFSHVHGQTYVNDSAWGRWETETFERIRASENQYIGYISPYVKTLITGKHAMPESKLVPFRNGFHVPSLRKEFAIGRDPLEHMLRSRSIPTDKKLLLAFGRADEYKGLDIALQAMIAITKQYSDYHGVLIASRFSKEGFIDALQTRLQQIAGSARTSISLFLGYEFELPKYLMQWPLTELLINIPTRDFCPLVPYEAQLMGHPGLRVLNSDLPCFEPTFREGIEGFLCAPTVESTTECFKRIAAMPAGELAAVLGRGRMHAEQNFDIQRNYIEGLFNLINSDTWQKESHHVSSEIRKG